MLNILTFDAVSVVFLNLLKQLKGIGSGEMNPNRLKAVSCVVLMRFVAVKNYGVALARRDVLSVFYVSERAVKNMGYQKTVVIFTNQMIALDAEKMPCADGVKVQSFRRLRRGREIHFRLL